MPAETAGGKAGLRRYSSARAPVLFYSSAGRTVGEAGRPSKSGQDRADLPVDADGPLLQLFGAECVRRIDADITGRGVLRSQSPEGVFDDGRRIAAHAQLQIHHPHPLVLPQKVLIPPGRGVPALVLDEGAVAPQVHGHGPAADRTARNKLCGDPHLPLLRHHAPDS